MNFNKQLIFALVLLIFSCKKNVDYYDLPLLSSSDNYQVVIEIPAGTNKKIEFNKEKKAFEVDQKNGKDRVVKFLPYIGNYGFFPSTYSDIKLGGDGDALDVLVLSENVSTGSVIEVIPIAMLKLIDDGELDYKVIAIPLDENKQIIKAVSFVELSENYQSIMKIIELWFLNYNKDDEARIDGWVNEKEAIKEINSNLL
ncbi:MAG: inorganic diphosphatase [Maribacter sp.]